MPIHEHYVITPKKIIVHDLFCQFLYLNLHNILGHSADFILHIYNYVSIKNWGISLLLYKIVCLERAIQYSGKFHWCKFSYIRPKALRINVCIF